MLAVTVGAHRSDLVDPQVAAAYGREADPAHEIAVGRDKAAHYYDIDAWLEVVYGFVRNALVNDRVLINLDELSKDH